MSTVSTDQIRNYKGIIADLIRSKGFRNMYVNLNVFDAINDSFNIVGFSLVEHLSINLKGKYELQSLVDFGFRKK